MNGTPNGYITSNGLTVAIFEFKIVGEAIKEYGLLHNEMIEDGIVNIMIDNFTMIKDNATLFKRKQTWHELNKGKISKKERRK